MAKSKLIKCKTCGEMMAKSAKRCPHCGAKQKLPVGVSLLITIIIIVTVFAVVAVLMNGITFLWMGTWSRLEITSSRRKYWQVKN